MMAEAEVSQKALTAWRLALKGDEKNSMALLDQLDRKYPKMKTVAFMKGQVLERLGKKKEAIAYYQAAVTGDDFDMFKQFKLAESLRTTGDVAGAIPEYRRLLSSAPGFEPARLGLVKSLLVSDKHSAEAKSQLKMLVQADPNAKEARELLRQLNDQTPAVDKVRKR